MQKRSEAATIISQLFKVTPAYVRLIKKDKYKRKYNSGLANQIREALANYKTGKESLIKTIKPSKKKIA